jgi:hypothetical protein
MANPGHAMASMHHADIQLLRTELINFKLRYQTQMSQLVRGMRELTELLEAKEVLKKEEISNLADLNMFMDSGLERIW